MRIGMALTWNPHLQTFVDRPAPDPPLQTPEGKTASFLPADGVQECPKPSPVVPSPADLVRELFGRNRP